MKVALIQYELYMNSYDRQHVAGEDIDAKGIKKAFLRRNDVEVCDILSINIIRDREERGEKLEYDLIIHFNHPSILFKNAINILFFQQYYEWNSINMKDLIREYDYVITPAHKVSIDYPEVLFFPLAVDTDLYKPVSKNSNYDFDIAFIGNRRMRDIDTYNHYLLPATKYNLAIYGNGWDIEGFEKYTPFWKKILGYEEAATLYSSIKLSICIHSRWYTDQFHLVTTRGFHALSCNSLIISDKIPVLQEMLPQGIGIIYTDGYEETEKLLDKYINDNEEREHIASKGRDWVIRNHTWDIRIEQLLRQIKII